MNPINDEMLSKDSTDVQEPSRNLEETKLNEGLKEQTENEQQINETTVGKNSNEPQVNVKESTIEKNSNVPQENEHPKGLNVKEISTDNNSNESQKNKHPKCENVKETSTEQEANEQQHENHEAKETQKLEISKEKEQKTLEVESETLNESGSETEMVNEKSAKSEDNEKDKSEKYIKQAKQTLESANLLEDLNKESSIASQPDTEEYEDVEDFEMPGEQDVDEIIVPDEAEAEDLTDGKDEDVEKETSLNGDVENDEELSYREESDMEETESETPLNEAEEETSRSSDIQERDEEAELEEGDDVESYKKSVNNETKDDTNSEIESETVAIEDEIKNAESPMEQPKTNQTTNLDEDNTTTQDPYDPLNCGTTAKERDGEDNEKSVKNVESENSNESQNLEKDNEMEEKNEGENDNEGNKNIDSVNENSMESQISKRFENAANEDDDDDDEVQFVETRNSPICIESDDDDGTVSNHTTKTTFSAININSENNSRTITTPITTVTVPKNIIVTRTSARKSTAKPPQNQIRASNGPATAVYVPQIQNKTNSINYLHKSFSTFNKQTFTGTSTQKIVDCIELLDSSDEESANTSRPQKRPVQQQRTPQKRTLLAAKGMYYKNKNNNNNNKNNKLNDTPANRLPHNFTPHIRQQPKKPAPPPLPPATPQSNFLNAVQLQPASMTGPNPPAFSALLSNKNVIIPNAFYGNPPSVRGASNEGELEKRCARWLENFLNQFCKPQFEPTHSCFVFLQRALKYKDYVRIKTMRTSMNSHAQNASNQLNIELMSDLKTIFFRNVKKITNYGQRFCELTCSAVPGKAVTLITHRLSGKVTLKTCNIELPKPISPATATNASTSSNAGSSNTSQTRKRQLEEDEDEYTPEKSVYKTKGKPPSENGDEDSGDMGGDDRKRSLRTKRTKRIDNSFSYNEDDLLAEYEIDDVDDEKLVQVEIERKIEEKRLEAQQQRQQQAKSFESAFIQAFARSIDGPTTSTKTKHNKAENQRIRLKNTTTATVTSIKQYTANNDAEDLLQATWIENLENDNTQIISDDDEPQEHRIYKKHEEQKNQEIQEQQRQRHQAYYKLPSNLSISEISSVSAANPKNSGRATKRTANRIQEVFITCDDDYDENSYFANTEASNVQPLYWPKNIDAQMTVTGKNKDRCVICNLNCQRLVHHYVNEHRGCETYNSRLSATQIKKLRQSNGTASVSLYKNGQNLYEAFCIFCFKTSRFMLRYWYQHYTMHTGEYAYRCSGCGIRKPTQSLLTLHHSQGCGEGGAIMQDYAYDAKSLQIEAKICSLCNYLQLHRSNIVKHLHTQHNVKQILPKHILTVVLMKIPHNMATGGTTTTMPYTQPYPTRRSQNSSTSSAAFSSSNSSSTFVIEDDEANLNDYEEILPEETSQHPPENQYYNYIPPYMQAALNSGSLSFENVEAGDDLSFMICGMLDVQMNTNDTN